MTVCKLCLLEKGDDFRKNRLVCRICDNNINKEKRKEAKKKYEYIDCKLCQKNTSDFRINRKICLECERKRGREYRKNTDTAKIWNQNNIVKMANLKHKWYVNNKRKIRKEENERLKCDNTFNMIKSHRRSIVKLIKKEYEKSKYLNCDSMRLRDWIEFQFTDNMKIENYTQLWNIDHVIPLCLIYKNNEYENICIHWLNLRPIIKKDNLTKNKYFTRQECIDHLEKIKEYMRIRNLEISSFRNFVDTFLDFCKTPGCGENL